MGVPGGGVTVSGPLTVTTGTGLGSYGAWAQSPGSTIALNGPSAFTINGGAFALYASGGGAVSAANTLGVVVNGAAGTNPLAGLGNAYIPVGQAGLDGGSYVIRAVSADPGLAASVAAAVREVDPNLERIHLRRLDDWVSDSLGDRRLPALLTGIMASVGLLLTALGIYGTVALEMGERRREIAIRVALGAGHARITSLVLMRGLLLALLGTGIGLPIFLPIGGALEAQLYETAPMDPVNTVSVVSVLFASAIVGCLRPIWIALRLHPLTILREI